MISHDATLVRTVLMRNDLDEMPEIHLEEKLEGRLSGSFKVAVDNLIAHGFADRETRQLTKANASISSNAYISYIKLICKTAECKTVLNPHNTINTYISSSFSKRSASDMRKFIRKATGSKRFNAAYRAVCDGTKARKDPLQEFAKTLSRSNAFYFYDEVNKLDESERSNLKRAAARFVARSRRN